MGARFLERQGAENKDMNITRQDRLFVWACVLGQAVQEGNMEKAVEIMNCLGTFVGEEDIELAKPISKHLAETEVYYSYHEHVKDMSIPLPRPKRDDFPDDPFSGFEDEFPA